MYLRIFHGTVSLHRQTVQLWTKSWRRSLLLVVVFGIWFIAAPSLLAQDTSLSQDQAAVQQEIRYLIDGADQVFLVWGVNGWAQLPTSSQPTGTIVWDGTMYSPMNQTEDGFVIQLQLPADTTIDYVFQILAIGNRGEQVEVWDVNGDPKQDYHTVATQDGIAEVYAPPMVRDQLPTSDPENSLISREIRYHIVGVSEVFLVWGINGWSTLPEEMRPPRTQLKDGLMYSPMDQVNEGFVIQLEVPPNTTIDYVFQLTKTENGTAIDVWDNNISNDYQIIASQSGVTEIEAPATIQNKVSIASQYSGLQRRDILLLVFGLSLVISSLVISYLPNFRTVLNHSPYRVLILLTAIIAIGAILRFNHITQPFVDAFSWRQVSVAMMAENFYKVNWNIFYPEVNWFGPGPNYQGREFQTVSYIAAMLYNFFGQQDWIGRTIAVLFGLWGIFALYQLTRLVWDEKHALAAAAVMAVMPASIVVERSFIPDPAMVALVTTSFWLFVLYLQTERWRYLVLAGLIGMWGFATKIPGLIVGLPMAYAIFAILGLQRTFRPARLVALNLFAIATLVPVAAYYLWVRHLALSYPPYHFAGDGNWLWQDGLQKWLSNYYYLPSLIEHYRVWMWTVPLIILIGISLVIPPPKYKDDQRKTPWIFHWWLLAGVVYYLIGAKELVENPWNFHILNPAAAVLAGHAIIAIGSLMSRITRTHATVVTAAVLLFVIGFTGYRGLKFIYYPYSSEAYELGLALRDISQTDDFVVTVGHDFGDPIAIYYSQKHGWGFPPASLDYDWTELPEDDDIAIQYFEDLRANGADWFGVVNEHYNDIWQNHPKLAAHIERTTEFQQTNAGGVIYRILSPEEFNNTDTSNIVFNIHYPMPEASEVFLVWGVDGWSTISEAVRPAGTIIKNGVMYTPMTRKEDAFITRLQVPTGVTIDYVFQITETRGGSAIEIWDTNEGQDYHTIAFQSGVIKVGENSPLSLEQPAVSVPVVSLPLLASLSLVLVGLGTILVIRRNFVAIDYSITSLFGRQLIYLRDLLHEMVVRDMKLRYKRSVLGIAWSLLNPLAQLLVFYFIFSLVLPLNIPNYALFVFIGLTTWTWFQSSLFQTTGAIVDNPDLIRWPGFPPAVLPIVTVITHLIHFLLALPILLIFLLLGHSPISIALLGLPFLIILQFLFTLSLSYGVATLHVTFRDTQYLLGILLTLAFYLTPIFYDPGFVPERFRSLYNLNPMVHLVDAYRAILLRGELPALWPLLLIGLSSAFILYFSYTIFTRASYRFVEEL